MINTTSPKKSKPEKNWIWTGSLFIQVEKDLKQLQKEETSSKDVKK